jgi:hypothetical protein
MFKNFKPILSLKLCDLPLIYLFLLTLVLLYWECKAILCSFPLYSHPIGCHGEEWWQRNFPYPWPPDHRLHMTECYMYDSYERITGGFQLLNFPSWKLSVTRILPTHHPSTIAAFHTLQIGYPTVYFPPSSFSLC